MRLKQLKTSHHAIWMLFLFNLHVTLSRDLYCDTPFKLSNAFLVPLHSLLLVSCHQREGGGCLSQAVTHHNTPGNVL